MHGRLRHTAFSDYFAALLLVYSITICHRHLKKPDCETTALIAGIAAIILSLGFVLRDDGL
jgi:hypothetical protein